jgi:hypothetical protein
MSETTVPPSKEGLSHSDKQAAERKIGGLLLPAVNALEEVLDDGSPGQKLQAAQFVIRFHFDGKGEGRDAAIDRMFNDITENQE